MKLFIFVWFALLAVAFSQPLDLFKNVGKVATGVVTVPGGAATGGAGALIGSGGDPNKLVEGAEYGGQQGADIASHAGR